MDAVKDVPAIGYSILANLGDDRQVTFQCFVGQDETDDAVNGRLDRIMGFIDRLKARSELPGLRAELDKHVSTLAQMREDKARLDIEFERSQASLDVQAAEINDQISKTTEAGVEAAKAAGRASFKPQGHVKTNLDRLNAGVKQIAAEKQKNVNEREAALQNYAVTENRYVEEIEKLQAKIAEREKAI